ncbi:MAG: cytochrome c family protein [Pseudomonadota bacterium]
MRFAPLRSLSLIALGLGLAMPAQADLYAALAAADLEFRDGAFRKCVARYTPEQGDSSTVGSHIYGVVGGSVAAVDGFNCSKVGITYGSNWTPERLDALLVEPRDGNEGTTMSLAGLRKQDERASVVAYLNRFSDGPLTLLASNDADPASADDADEYEFGVLFDAPGVDTTFYYCVACHSERIVAQQGLTREEWDDMLVWMVEEQGMSEIDGPDRTEILDYLAENYNTDRPNFPPPMGN